MGRELGPGVRVVLLRAEGEAFSAGLDRRLLPGGTPPPGRAGLLDVVRLADAAGSDALEETLAGYQEAFTWWRRPGLVSVATVQGPAVGAGFQLALACDLRLLADDARLSIREPALGLVPDLGGTKALVDLLGYPRALEVCATGRWIEAQEALDMRLAELVVPRAQLDETARELAAVLLAAPAEALAETKALLQGAGARSYDEQLAAERAASARLLRAALRRTAPGWRAGGQEQAPPG